MPPTNDNCLPEKQAAIALSAVSAVPEAAPCGSILIADDDVAFRRGLGQVLTRAGFACEFAGSAAEVVAQLEAKDCDVLLSDINMPGNSGLELIEKIPALREGLPVILLTGNPTLATATRSVGLRVTAYISKPPALDELYRLLHAAVAERRSQRVLKDNRQRLQNWDQEIERLQRLMQQSAGVDRQTAMQSYLQLTLRNLVVGLVELENLLTHDGERLGTNQVLKKQELFNAVRKTVAVLHKTKDHFKSKDLGELRKELETLLD